jgi:hypothetical protein
MAAHTRSMDIGFYRELVTPAPQFGSRRGMGISLENLRKMCEPSPCELPPCASGRDRKPVTRESTLAV